MSKLADYFDINRDVAPRLGKEGGPQWLPQWLALLAGVVIQPSLQAFRESGQWSLPTWGWALFAVIAAVLIFPVIYRAAFDANKPFLVHLAPIFAAGLGWESLLGTAMKVATVLPG